MIDTHAHLDSTEDAVAVVERARAAGVERIISVGTGVDSARATLSIAEQHDGVYAALGLHPNYAGRERLADLRPLLSHDRVVAIGETGLDFYRDYAPHDEQQRLFTEHLDLAASLELPVVIHTRATSEETLAALTAFDGTVILHCFSDPAMLEAALERGYYVSFAGNVTYPKAQELRDAAARVPADRILAETDTPYLAPVPHRGKPNEPAYVVHTVTALAAARGEDPAELAARIDANATAAFRLP